MREQNWNEDKNKENVDNSQRRIKEELVKDLKEIDPPKFNWKNIGDVAKDQTIEMGFYCELCNLSNEAKEIW